MIELIKNIIKEELNKDDYFYQFISGLTARERLVLRLRDQSNKNYSTLEDIGKKLEITRERVRQIEDKAKRKIAIQNNIISMLSSKISEYVFSEEEIEKAFLDYSVGSLPDRKMLWQDFSKKLWQTKK